MTAVAPGASKDPVDVLREARALIEDRKNWTQEVWYGALTECYCAGGAIGRAATGEVHPCGVDFRSPKADGARLLLEEVVGEHIPVFNDYATHEEVLAAFDRAIALGESRRAGAGR